MRQTLSRGVFAATAATGILSLSCSAAIADTGAAGGTKDSGGVLAGNVVQVPVHVPVNLCGNTVNGLAALNTAFGNDCRNDSRSKASSDEDDDMPPSSGTGETSSPGDDDDDCPTPTPSATPTATPPPPTRVVHKPRPTTPSTRTRTATPVAGEEQPGEPPQLAETGSKTLLATSAASAALLTGGVMMYRRGRAAARR